MFTFFIGVNNQSQVSTNIREDVTLVKENTALATTSLTQTGGHEIFFILLMECNYLRFPSTCRGSNAVELAPDVLHLGCSHTCFLNFVAHDQLSVESVFLWCEGVGQISIWTFCTAPLKSLMILCNGMANFLKACG